MKKLTLILFTILIVMSLVKAQTIRYVKPTSSGSGNGSSWANASNNFQAMINASAANDQVWVAAGDFQPAEGQSFNMKEGVKIYGHFAGTETNLNQRNLNSASTTFLSGNSFIVIDNKNLNLSNASVIDGFTIRNGYAPTIPNGPGNYLALSGGGINNENSSGKITNCYFLNNFAEGDGGAIFCKNSNSIISKCIFEQNSVTIFSGSAISIYEGNPLIDECIFKNNPCDKGTLWIGSHCTIKNSVFYGNSPLDPNNPNIISTCIYSNAHSPKIINCLFAENSPNFKYQYVARDEQGASTEYINCTFANNAIGSSLFYANASSMKIKNCIVWGNTGNIFGTRSGGTFDIQHTNTQGGLQAGQDNINQDPLFVNNSNSIGPDNKWATADDGLQLLCSSPSEDSGNNSFMPPNITNDFGGNNRINNIIDMGAYEAAAVPNGKLYVTPSGSGTKNGSSWANASDNLQAMINLANCSDSVFVKAGNYSLVSGQSFIMKEGVRIYGHFAGNETNLAQRNLNSANISFLLGNGSKVISNDGNNLTILAILDGFTIKNGNSVSGSGMYNREASPTINNCIFENNTASTDGAGVYNSIANPIFTQCIFRNNTNGGMLNITSNPKLINCVFENNSSTNSGGGMRNVGGTDIKIINSIFTGNTTAVNGAAIFNNNASISLINSTLVSNTASGSGGGLYNQNASPIIYNSIIWNNSDAMVNSGGTPVVNYSNVQGAVPVGTGNISANPSFANISLPAGTDGIYGTADDGLQLACASVSINAGSNSLVPNDINKDFSGNPRIKSTIVDMGAYEFASSASGKLFVTTTGAGSMNGDNWANATNNIQWAIDQAYCSRDSVFVKAGNYTMPNGQSLNMKESVKIYGHFSGTETTLSQRNLNNTDISFLIGNAASVIVNNNNGLTNLALLDGFTIKNGNSTNGGGMRNVGVSPTIRNCTFQNNTASNSGGGVYNSGSAVIFDRCIFQNNTAESGGGMSNFQSNTQVKNAVFIGNSASSNGGGMSNFSGLAGMQLVNSIFNNNSSALGSAVYNNFSPMNFISNTVYNNTGTGGSIHITVGANVTIGNSIVWGNQSGLLIPGTSPTISYSNVQGGVPTGVGNISSDPLFANASNAIGSDNIWGTIDDGLIIGCGSPSINTGSNSNIPVGISADLAGIPRIQGSITDMGAYEFISIINKKIFVKQGGAGNKIGDSWSNATDNLQWAINKAECASDSVLVAKGDYLPNSGFSFIMREGVKIYGHFAGTEANLGQRNLFSVDTTFLIGNGSKVINNDNNGLTNAAVLDGFTIKNGTSVSGSGMYNREVSPIVNNCVFENNSASADGAGVYNSLANPVFYKCIFKNNTNGGMLNIVSNTEIIACIFLNNSSANSGAGLRNVGCANLKVINSLFFGNNTQMDGAAIFNSNSPITLTNSTISNNIATGNGGGIYNLNASPTINNSIIWNNGTGIVNSGGTVVISYSNVEGGVQSGTGNTSIDPLFNNIAKPIGLDNIWYTFDDGYKLNGCQSTLINAGNNSLVPNGISTDINGVARIQSSNVDMGCYETIEVINKKHYVKLGGAGTKDGSSWANASSDFQTTVNYACAGDSVFVAGGSYQPALNQSFTMKEGVKIYGHFAGTEAYLSQRNLNSADTTFLNGNNNRVIHNNNNGLTNAAILDGFTIQNGLNVNVGGGILNSSVSPVFSNCIIRKNESWFGAGVTQFGEYAGSITMFNDCIIERNIATDATVPGMLVEAASINLNRCVFDNNGYDYGNASALLYIGSATSFVLKADNCIFVNHGGAETISVSGKPTSIFTNCTITNNDGNSAYFPTSGGSASAQTSTWKNCILWNSIQPFPNSLIPATITYTNSTYQLPPGEGNTTSPPMFVNQSNPKGPDGKWFTADDGLRLAWCSPNINTGDNAGVSATDITGAARVQQGGVDRGAYENTDIVDNVLPTANSSITQWQSGVTVYGDCGNLIAMVHSSIGPYAITGSTTAKVWLETTQPNDFVKRHYEITPAANSDISGGRVVLYFTQAEFDAFNSINTTKLPTGPTDAAGKANLIIEKRPGTSSNGSGLPDTFTGIPETINPVDANIIWNAASDIWEVTIDVRGFSGFFVKTVSNPLPVTLISFEGKATENGNELTWKTSNEKNFSHFEVQKSQSPLTPGGGISSGKFEKIGEKKSDESRKYEYLDRTPPLGAGGLGARGFYRLKMIDLNGGFAYSKIIFIAGQTPPQGVGATEASGLYPNPTSDKIFFSNTADNQAVAIYNQLGVLIRKANYSHEKGIDLSKLESGFYFMKVGDKIYKVLKVN